MELIQQTPEARVQDTVVAAYADRLRRAEAVSDADEQALVLKLLSQHYSRTCQWAAAERTARESLDVARRAGKRQRVADALTRLGVVFMDTRPEGAYDVLSEALGIYQEMGDRSGQARCLINFGILHAKGGKVSVAASEYGRAAELARTDNAQEIAGQADLNAGVMLLDTGNHKDAAGRLAAALRAFTAIDAKPLALAARYNLAHLARETGDHQRARVAYNEIVETAAQLNMADVELGARAGRGLSALAAGDQAAAQAELTVIEARLASQPTWAFQCRELVEALSVRLAIAVNDTERAVARLAEAIPKQRDACAAMWLLADCTPPLMKVGGYLPMLLRETPRANSKKGQTRKGLWATA